MCTVTFLPSGSSGFILTSNRDERKQRKTAEPPRRFTVNDISVFFPRDPEANGTWIATGANQYTLCLLNGAFVPHERKPAYRMSRGLVLTGFFDFNSVDSFITGFDFSGIEPFTLIVARSAGAIILHELIWDGEQLHVSSKDASQAHIWSSVTLYSPEVISRRKNFFRDWLSQHPDYTLETVLNLHEFGGIGEKQNDFRMYRNESMHTLSTTLVYKTAEETKMVYREFASGQDYHIRII